MPAQANAAHSTSINRRILDVVATLLFASFALLEYSPTMYHKHSAGASEMNVASEDGQVANSNPFQLEDHNASALKLGGNTGQVCLK